MKRIVQDGLLGLLKSARISPRLIREIRFRPDEYAWDASELLAITTRSGNEGVLLVELDGERTIVPFEIKRSLLDTRSGRSKPITCDFCCTWQRGGNAATITFTQRSGIKSVTFLCCADVACSLHVRDQTPQAALSRTQLREDMTPEQRVARLRQNLRKITDLKLT